MNNDNPHPSKKTTYNGITLFFITIFLLLFIATSYLFLGYLEGTLYLLLIMLAILAALSASSSILLALKHPATKILSNATFIMATVFLLTIGFFALANSGSTDDIPSIISIITVLMPIICLALIFNKAEGLPAGLSKKDNPPKTWHLGLIIPISLIISVIILLLVSIFPPPTIENNNSTQTSCVSPPEDNSAHIDDPESPIECHGVECLVVAKPVIYLYPTTTTNIKVNLSYDGEITTYPEIGSGWQVTASPDGTLINQSDNKEYSYLFWEGIPNYDPAYDMTTGFIVSGDATQEFLQNKLAQIGLTPKEYNEFIVYWSPKMQNNPYNLIHFATAAEYDAHAKLTISPTPDKILRVFMVFQPLTQPTAVTPQSFPAFTRTGFTVIEWGGSELPANRHL